MTQFIKFKLSDSVQHLGPCWSGCYLLRTLQNQEALVEPRLTQPHPRHRSTSIRPLLQLCLCRVLLRHLNLSKFDMREQLAPPGVCLGLGPLLQLQRPLHRAASPQDS